MYFKLKSAILEETLMDISFDDLDTTEPMNECSQSSQSVKDADSSHEEINKLQNTDEKSPLKFNLEKENTCWNVDKKEDDRKVEEIWGSHLSNKLKPEVKPSIPKKSENATVKLSQKLFKNSSFSKRNPRKSLSSQSLNRSESNLSMSFSQPDSQSSQNSAVESLPDMDKLLSSQAESQEFKTNAAYSSQPLPKTLRSIDKGWLDRCTLSTSLSQPDSGFSSLESTYEFSKPNDVEEHKTFGLRNIDSKQLKNVINTPVESFGQDNAVIDDIVYNSESEDEASAFEILKKRKIDSSQTSPKFKNTVCII